MVKLLRCPSHLKHIQGEEEIPVDWDSVLAYDNRRKKRKRRAKQRRIELSQPVRLTFGKSL